MSSSPQAGNRTAGGDGFFGPGEYAQVSDWWSVKLAGVTVAAHIAVQPVRKPGWPRVKTPFLRLRVVSRTSQLHCYSNNVSEYVWKE